MHTNSYHEMMWGLVNSIEEIFEAEEQFTNNEEVVDGILKTIVNLEQVWNYDERLSNKDFEKIANLKIAMYV